MKHTSKRSFIIDVSKGMRFGLCQTSVRFSLAVLIAVVAISCDQSSVEFTQGHGESKVVPPAQNSSPTLPPSQPNDSSGVPQQDFPYKSDKTFDFDFDDSNQDSGSNEDCILDSQDDPDLCEVEFLIHLKTNEYRAGRSGLKPLKYLPEIAYAARRWSETMANGTGRLSHAGFDDGTNFGVMTGRVPNTIIRFFTNENVLYDYFNSSHSADHKASTMAHSWWTSPGHKFNMLQSFGQGQGYQGIGVFRRSDGRYYATQILGRP